jgi:hypothetical protein
MGALERVDDPPDPSLVRSPQRQNCVKNAQDS